MYACIVDLRKLEHGFRRISARIPYNFLKGMRRMMFQLSGFYYSFCSFFLHTVHTEPTRAPCKEALSS